VRRVCRRYIGGYRRRRRRRALLSGISPSSAAYIAIRHGMPSFCNTMADVTARPGGIAPPIPSSGSGVSSCVPIVTSWTNSYRQQHQQLLQDQQHSDYHHLVRMHQEQQYHQHQHQQQLQHRFVHHRVVADNINNIDRLHGAPDSEDMSTVVCKVPVSTLLNGDRRPPTNDVNDALPPSPATSPLSLVNAAAGNVSDVTVFRPLTCITPR